MGVTTGAARVKKGGANFNKRLLFKRYAKIDLLPHITLSEDYHRVDMDRTELGTAYTDISVSEGKFYAEIEVVLGALYDNAIGLTTTPTNPLQGSNQNGAERDYALFPNGKLMRGGRIIKNTGKTWQDGDVVQLAIDADDFFLWVGVNGDWAVDKPAKISPGTYHIALYRNSNRVPPTFRVNFGDVPLRYHQPPYYAPGFGELKRASK